MTKQEITIKYRTPLHIAGTVSAVLMFPLWGVAGCLGMLVTCPLLLTCDAKLAATFLVFSSLLAAGIATTIVSLDHSMILGPNGLAFPMLFLPKLRGRRERSWSDVGRVRFIPRNNKPLNKGKIEIFFRSGSSMIVDFACLSEESLEQFLLALEVWGKGAEKDPELLSLANHLHDAQHLKGLPSFTSMWEEEMGRRFSSTAFVPLSGGTLLRNGSLKVVRQMAFGGLSAIYLAQWKETESVVLKEFIVPDVDARLKAKAAELFSREASLLTKLSHPQIARVRDHFVEDNRTYLMLDYIPGSDLRQIVKQRGPQAEGVVRQWAEQLCDILIYLHGQSPPVIHRDLTPDNIVLAHESVVLIDFGAANEYIGTATGTLVGKQSFIAPEQFRGETTLRSDIYSFGATLYFLLTGQDPEPLAPSCARDVVPEISQAMNKLILDCTAFEEDERIDSALELKERLTICGPKLVSSVE